MSKESTSTRRSVFVTIGASNHTDKDREANDYYATSPKAAEMLCDILDLHNVWECAAGGGHLAKVFEERGILGRKSDIVDRTGDTEIYDFLLPRAEVWNGDIVTNPPYKFAYEFITNALNVVAEGCKVCMFLPIRYLEGKQRKRLFLDTHPLYVYVSSSRINCAMNGDFEKYKDHTANSYCWMVWEKGYKGETILRWFN